MVWMGSRGVLGTGSQVPKGSTVGHGSVPCGLQGTTRLHERAWAPSIRALRGHAVPECQDGRH